MTDFLLELRSEEIPARMQAEARESLARLFAGELAKAGLSATETVTYATPRRLALIARGLPDATQAVREEVKGPKASAPEQALAGFLRKTGLTREQLVERDGVLFAVTERAGRATAAVLAEAIPAVIRAFPWPKSMRWGAASASTESLRWVRPLQGIVALFGADAVPVEIAGITSGAATVGHRFHHPGAITIGSAADYVEKLRACHVVVDQDERLQIIALGATMAANKAGLTLVRDEGLLIENAGLTEWPVPLLGRFDEAFLDVPPEVIQLTARVNQKYFVCRTPLPLAGGAAGGAAGDAHADTPSPDPSRKREGSLANAFVCTANIDASDGGAKIVEGNRKVLAARLSDARFFYETDLKVSLDDQREKLGKIVFHEKLGTVADKVERVAKLARWLVEEGIVTSSPLLSGEGQGASAPRGEDRGDNLSSPSHPAVPGGPLPLLKGEGKERFAALAERAARLCKADLVTGMVGEFPELQGLMGGYYAAAQGEPPEVAAAIRDHYKPVGQGDDVPTAPVTVAVSLADKLDTLVGFYSNRLKPTGSRDPFALRRAAISCNALIVANGLRARLSSLISFSFDVYYEQWDRQFLAYENYFDGSLKSRVPEGQSRLTDTFFIDCRPDGPAFQAIYNGEIADPYAERTLRSGLETEEELLDFFADRLKVQQREAGVRHDLIDAVFALGGEDDLVRLLARVQALQAFVGTEDGANLLAGYKRAANILKKEGWASSSPLLSGEGQGASAPRGEDSSSSLSSPSHSAAPSGPLPLLKGEGFEPAERALLAALDAAEPAAADAVVREAFEGAMAALATLRAPIDAFFESVTVNDPDPAKRERRLALLARVRDAVHSVADFSKIEG